MIYMEDKQPIHWSQNFRWYHILGISLLSGVIYFITGLVIFDYILVIGIIFSIVTAIKQRKNK